MVPCVYVSNDLFEMGLSFKNQKLIGGVLMKLRIFMGLLVAIFTFTTVSPSFAASAEVFNKTMNTINPKLQKEFQKFIDDKKKNGYTCTECSYVPTIQEIQEFVDYAADTGIIENSEIEKSSITKSLVRASLKVVVAAGETAGYRLAAHFLDHSLQDSPSDVIYNNGSWQSNLVRNGTAYKNLISKVRSDLSSAPYSYPWITSYSTLGSMVLNNPTDLFLALNKVNYKVNAKKTNGTWDIQIMIEDKYDFEYQDWMNAPGFYGEAATILNNYGAYAESIGAIVPYNILIETKELYVQPFKL